MRFTLDTVGFVDELFATFGPKTVAAPGISHMQTQPLIAPGIPQSENFSQQTLQYSPRSSQQRVGYTAAISAQGGYESGGFNSRKRTFHEGFQQESSERDDTAHNNRSFKALRRSRGSGNGGRGDWSGRDGWRASNVPEAQPFSAPVGLGFPPMMPPPFPPLDQNDPMAAMMLLQNMGFPQMPGMPPLPIQNSAVPPTMDQRQRDQAGKSTERCPFYETQGICYLGAACPYQHGSQTKNGDGMAQIAFFCSIPIFHFWGRLSANFDLEYDPKTANIVLDIDRPSGGFSNGNFGGSSMRGGHERGRGRGRGGSDRGGFGSRGGRGRSEFSLPGPNEDQSITTIVVEQIPEDKFDENTVREFFAQYGDIDEITLQPHKRLALIKYNSYDAAKRAWSSPKVIFDNRFVKVYWHRPPRKSERNGDHQRSSSATRVESDGSPFNKEEFERQQEEAQKAYEEKMKKRKETEEAKQMLERQRDELLKKQEEERIRLMQRLAGKSDSTGNDTSSEQRAESTRHTNGEAHHGGETGTTGENVSEQTKQLRAQLAALEAEAKSLGIDPASSRFSHGAPTHGNGGYRGFHTGYATAYRGRGAFSSRGRAGYDPSYRGRGSFHGRGRGGSGSGGVLRLDNRPRRVAISGIEFDTEKDEALRQYLIVRATVFSFGRTLF